MHIEKIVPPPVPPPEPEFQVTLTYQEAVDLVTVAGLFSGTPWGTVRETLDPLWERLKALGVPPAPSRLIPIPNPYSTAPDSWVCPLRVEGLP